MAMTTRSDITQEVNNFYVKELLTRAVSLFTHNRWGQVKDIPRKSGTNVIKFRRYENLNAATTPLTEGTTPAGSKLSATEIEATVRQYGDFVTVTDVVSYESIDSVLAEAAGILGDQAGETLDILTREVLAAGLNVFYTGGKTARGDITGADKIDSDTLKKVIRNLQSSNAKTVTKQINATTGVSTDPIAAAYVAVIDPSTLFDLNELDGFTPIEKYSAQMSVMEGEVGKFKEIRFVLTPMAKVFTGAGAGGIDVHATIILGRDAYGTSRISGEAFENIVKGAGSAGTADPLNQRATSGWKATFTAKILNDNFMARVEHAVSE